jgi:predicted alpha/beta superfamily hydrolase
MSRRSRNLLKTLLPIPLAAALAAALLLAGCGGPAPQASATAAVSAAATTIRVHHPAGSMFLRGDGGGLSWSHGARMTGTDPWVISVTLSQRLQFKPLADDRAWSRGPNYAVDPGATLDIWPRFNTDAGHVQRIDQWWSNGLQDNRPLWIYTPPSYDEQPAERFPVVYMHDGQNLFDAAYSFGGVTWDVPGAMDRGAADGSLREAIVVGVGNTANRIWEYTPSDGGYGGGGASQYVQFITDELKPQVDRLWHTSAGRLDTAIVGSSLGGLLSACAGVWRPDVFGLVGAMSPSTWWDNTMVIGMVQGTASSPVKPARVYVDSGDSGTDNDDVINTGALAQAYQNVGWIQVKHVVGHGDTHTESSWARRLPGAMHFLLGPRASLP